MEMIGGRGQRWKRDRPNSDTLSSTPRTLEDAGGRWSLEETRQGCLLSQHLHHLAYLSASRSSPSVTLSVPLIVVATNNATLGLARLQPKARHSPRMVCRSRRLDGPTNPSRRQGRRCPLAAHK